MSDTKPNDLASDQVQQISGGGCTIDDAFKAIDRLTEAYESLVDFTSHVIERVSGP